ncbi:MAG: ADOP family duplicated permease [Candidatus Sulfotelmatobacter sp.]
MGRVNPGIGPDELKARLAVLSPQILAGAVPNDWDENGREGFTKLMLVASPAATGASDVRRQFKQPLNILMVVVGLVLMIACANIASLMFARGAARSKEIALRKALGAPRARLIRQLLTECFLLSTAGALLGIFFARWGTAFLVRYISTGQSKIFLDLSLDARILAFTAAVAVLAGLVFGAFPALRCTDVSLTAAMKGSQADESDRRVHFRPGKWAVSSQVALSLVLLVVAGLFLRSLLKLTTLDAGFDRSDVLIVNANLKSTNIPSEQRLAVYDEIEIRLRSLPGVVSVGRSVRTPISNLGWNESIQVDSPNAPIGYDALVYFNFISSGYFHTLLTPVLAGRNFNSGDTKTSPQVAIVNEAFARKFFSSKNPVGRYFREDTVGGKASPPIQIVGLVKDSKYESLREDTVSQAFFPASQIPAGDEAENFVVRTGSRPAAIVRLVQDDVARFNKGISIDFQTLEEQVDDSIIQERLLATLSAFFGALALLLAMIGLYGALSYLVTQRRTEFGVRMALGAPPRSILWLVMREIAAVLVGGVLAGIAVSLTAVRLLQKLLFGLSAEDTVTMVCAVAVLSAVALFAGYLPARRAMRVDPMVALRYE